MTIWEFFDLLDYEARTRRLPNTRSAALSLGGPAHD